MLTSCQKAERDRVECDPCILSQYYDVVFSGPNNERLSSPELNDATRAIIVWTFAVRHEEDAKRINDLLCDAEFYRIDSMLLITILRSTFRFRNFVPCWEDKVTEAVNIMKKRGVNYKHWLRGLREFN